MARTREFDKKKVLQKALDLFWQQGFYGTSAQDLVDTLGISRSSLYATFGDKRTLYLRALHLYRTQMSDRLIEMIQTSSNLETTIRDIFKLAIHEVLEARLSRGCFMVNSSIELAVHDKEVAAIVKQNQEAIQDAFFLAIQKGQQAGSINKSQSPQALSRFLFNSISGIRVASKYIKDKTVYDDIIAVNLHILKP